MTRRSFLPALLLLAALSSRVDSAPRAVPPLNPTPPTGPVDARLALPPWTGATRVVRGDDGRSVAWAEGRLGKVERVTTQELWRLLDQLGPQLGLDAPRDELEVESIERDELGMHHVRLVRVHRGLPVVESDVVLHFAADGTLAVVNGRYPASLRLDSIAASFDEAPLIDRAVDAARIAARARGEQTPDSTVEKPRTRRVVWPEPARIALEVLVDFAPHQRWLVYVDLLRGVPLATRSLVQNNSSAQGSGVDSGGTRRSLNITWYDQQQVYGTLDTTNGSSGARIATLNANYQETFNTGVFSSASTEFSDKAAVDVHANMRVVHDYFKTKHGRNSWNGSGADIVAVAHYGRNYANAFWNGQLMAFGDGDGRTLIRPHYCLDVAAHELTHAVIDSTVGLVYANQSGALNEHFADVFGALIDTDDWTMGEHCVGQYMGGFLRSMSNPPAGDQPGHMDDYEDLPNTEQGDWGGVHVNSGIPNRAAYLIGSQAGRDALGKIWYRILAQRYLNQRSQFVDLRRAALRACSELSLGDVCTTVSGAFDQVGILDGSSGGGGGTGGCPANSHYENGYCYCDEGYRVNASRTGCEKIPTIQCPPNSHQVGDACYCNDGYVPSGNGCEPERTACPPNSHREGSECVCDAGYQGSPNSGFGCEKSTIDCPPNSRPGDTSAGERADGCYCLEGWVVNDDRSGCKPGSSGCGAETYFGRCDGHTLIYCNSSRIVVYDCAEDGMTCALENAEIGNNCVEATDACGGLTWEGECSGNVLRWCQDGAPRQTDCGARGCLWVDDQTGYSCNPCPENAELRDGSQGRACYCRAGYEPDGAEGCRKSDGPDGGEKPDGGENPDDGEKPDGGDPDDGEPGSGGDTDRDRRGRRGSGCSTTATPVSTLALLLPMALTWLRRRSRALPAAALMAGACATPQAGRTPDEPQPTPASEPAPKQKEQPQTARELPSDAITLSKGETWTSDDAALRIHVKDVIDISSPCPPGAKCVWSGVMKRAILDVTLEGETSEWRLDEGDSRTAGAWRVELVQVSEPTISLTVRRVMLDGQ